MFLLAFRISPMSSSRQSRKNCRHASVFPIHVPEFKWQYADWAIDSSNFASDLTSGQLCFSVPKTMSQPNDW
ncbi:hypothetical protein D3C83_231600 [compost metagenome]